MGRRYAIVDASVWNETEFRKLPDEAQRLFFYLTTCPHSEANAYVLSQVMMCDDLQWDIGRIDRALKYLAKKPYVLYDATARLVYVPGYWNATWNRIPNANTAGYIARHLYHLPSSPLKAKAIADLRSTGWWPERVEPILSRYVYIPEQDDLPLDDGRQGNLLPAESEKLKKVEKPPKREATKLPADWQPTVQQLAYARENGVDGAELDYQIKNFRRYWSGDGKPMKDWEATWANAIDRAVKQIDERGGRRNGANGNGHTDNFGVPETLGPDWAMRMKLWYGPKRIWQGAWGPKPGEPYCEVPAQFLAPPPQ